MTARATPRLLSHAVQRPARSPTQSKLDRKGAHPHPPSVPAPQKRLARCLRRSWSRLQTHHAGEQALRLMTARETRRPCAASHLHCTPEPPEARPKSTTPTKSAQLRIPHKFAIRARRIHIQARRVRGRWQSIASAAIGTPSPTHRPAGELRNARRGTALSRCKRGSAPTRDQPRESRNRHHCAKRAQQEVEAAAPGATASAGRRTELTQQGN